MQFSKNRIAGTASAILSSATFGLAPIFTIKLLDAGYSPCEALSYRWGIAALFLIAVGLLARHSFRISKAEFGTVFWLSLLRAGTSFALAIAYANIASGVASTIHFIYPLAVAAGMMLFFHERFSPLTFAAILTSIVGATLLSIDGSEIPDGNTTMGILAATLSVVCYGGYMIGVKQSCASKMDATVLTCYVMALSALFFIGGGLLTGGVRMEHDPELWGYILGLSIPATAVSNIALVWGIKRIGPTLTSFFGALEPLTAVVIGIWLRNEPFTMMCALGMALTILAVFMAAQKKEN